MAPNRKYVDKVNNTKTVQIFNNISRFCKHRVRKLQEKKLQLPLTTLCTLVVFLEFHLALPFGGSLGSPFVGRLIVAGVIVVVVVVLPVLVALTF